MRDGLIELYGGECECCEEDKNEFLTIDHVSGGGSLERKSVGPTQILWRLWRLGVRQDGYRLLCHNCNAAYAVYGSCPHQLAVSA